MIVFISIIDIVIELMNIPDMIRFATVHPDTDVWAEFNVF